MSGPAREEPLIGDEDLTLDYVEAAPIPEDADLASVAALAARMPVLERDVADAQAALERAQEALQRLREVDLPEALTSLGLAGLDLVGGGRVELSKAVHVNISEEHRPAAHAWFRERGLGSLIKNVLALSFGKDADAAAQAWVARAAEFKAENPGVDLEYAQKESIHAGTLKAQVKRFIKAKTPFPRDLLGYHEVTYAVVTMPGDGDA